MVSFEMILVHEPDPEEAWKKNNLSSSVLTIELVLKMSKENRKKKTENRKRIQKNTANLSRSVFTTIGNRICFSLSLKPALQRAQSPNRQKRTNRRKNNKSMFYVHCCMKKGSKNQKT